MTMHVLCVHVCMCAMCVCIDIIHMYNIYGVMCAAWHLYLEYRHSWNILLIKTTLQ